MDLRLINRNLLIEKHGYIIKRLLTKYREIFPPLVVVRTRGSRNLGPLPHNDRGREYFAILSQ